MLAGSETVARCLALSKRSSTLGSEHLHCKQEEDIRAAHPGFPLPGPFMVLLNTHHF